MIDHIDPIAQGAKYPMRNWIDIIEAAYGESTTADLSSETPMKEGVEVHNNVTYYRNPTGAQFFQLMKKHDLRGIVSGRDVYVWDAGAEIHFRACSDLSLSIPGDASNEDEEDEFAPSLPFYAHTNESRGDWEWSGRQNVGVNCKVMVEIQNRKEMLDCARFAALCRYQPRQTSDR